MTDLHLVPRFSMSGAVPPLVLNLDGENFSFIIYRSALRFEVVLILMERCRHWRNFEGTLHKLVETKIPGLSKRFVR
jgi:hypothetical protein